MPASSKSLQSGFSLIELVIGITTFAIALTIVTGVVAPLINRSVEPIYQVRATELAQSMLNEILGKYYDDESDRNGGRIRCDEDLNDDGQLRKQDGEMACSAVMGPEQGENSRKDFDDVDDYNGYYEDDILQNSLGLDMEIDGEELYSEFAVGVTVFYDSDMDAIANSVEIPAQEATGNIKFIQVTVTTPDGEDMVFSSFKHNY
ncbi:type IV pilus modification PilV family protein [Planctobacterium marinum]|uniref:MSHA biogenesis protein MshD n=1 Tax=Planctobacterium marinum TaxID=1631968 RepID=A0AA48HR56_9ALTE|nr:MSHA biogenesis protein MshD [Planctobacterium marinum]